ncbi:MAG: hypothetical protein M5U28_43495 [Sandaracinaceae bacterium]|nr:hypothetical protein [Sandaracinaceae bacterium]
MESPRGTPEPFRVAEVEVTLLGLFVTTVGVVPGVVKNMTSPKVVPCALLAIAQ